LHSLSLINDRYIAMLENDESIQTFGTYRRRTAIDNIAYEVCGITARYVVSVLKLSGTQTPMSPATKRN
jgi:hypothetical protein